MVICSDGALCRWVGVSAQCYIVTYAGGDPEFQLINSVLDEPRWLNGKSSAGWKAAQEVRQVKSLGHGRALQRHYQARFRAWQSHTGSGLGQGEGGGGRTNTRQAGHVRSGGSPSRIYTGQGHNIGQT